MEGSTRYDQVTVGELYLQLNREMERAEHFESLYLNLEKDFNDLLCSLRGHEGTENPNMARYVYNRDVATREAVDNYIKTNMVTVQYVDRD